MKDLLGVRSLGRADLEALIESAASFRATLDRGERVAPALEDVCVANMFFEPSTRTRLSFDLAAQRLGAKVITFFPETSSSAKGEGLRDTLLTVSAIGADILVVRHSQEGVPQMAAEWTGLPTVNAGDGANEHPTQALLDAVTLYRHFGRVENLKIAVVGDIVHSRVSGSLTGLLPALGAQVTLVGPEDWLAGETMATSSDLDAVLGDVDVVYLLRVQTERGGVIDDSYVTRFGLDARRASRLHPDAVIMHPGPLNRGVEVAEEVADSPRSLILEQVRNGVPTRMAVLSALGGVRG